MLCGVVAVCGGDGVVCLFGCGNVLTAYSVRVLLSSVLGAVIGWFVSVCGAQRDLGSVASVRSSDLLRAMGVESVSVESSGGVSVSAVGALTGVSGGSPSYVACVSVSVSCAAGVSGAFVPGAALTAPAMRVASSCVLVAVSAGAGSVRGSGGGVASGGRRVVHTPP